MEQYRLQATRAALDVWTALDHRDELRVDALVPAQTCEGDHRREVVPPASPLRQPCASRRNTHASDDLSLVVEHVQQRSVLLGVGLLEEPPWPDGIRHGPPQRTGREVPGKRDRLADRCREVTRRSRVVPHDGAVSVEACASQTGASPAYPAVDGIEDGEPVPADSLMARRQERRQALRDRLDRSVLSDDVGAFAGGGRLVVHGGHASDV